MVRRGRDWGAGPEAEALCGHLYNLQHPNPFSRGIPIPSPNPPRPHVVHVWVQGPCPDGRHRLLLLSRHHPPGRQGGACWPGVRLGIVPPWYRPGTAAALQHADCLASPPLPALLQGLERGVCEAAGSVGVNLTLVHSWTRACLRAGMLSDDGRCKTLDASAGVCVAGVWGRTVPRRALLSMRCLPHTPHRWLCACRGRRRSHAGSGAVQQSCGQRPGTALG